MGILLVVFASMLFGIFPSIQKNVLASGVTPITLVMICNGSAAAFSLLFSVIGRKKIRITGKQLRSLILIGAFGLFATDFLLDIAYTMIPVGYVTMIHFLYPTLVCIVMTVFFHEKMTRNKGFAIVFSIAGLILLAGSDFSGSFAGIIVAAITAVTYVFYMIATDRTAAREVDPMLRVFYTNLTVTIVAFCFSLKMKVSLPSAPGLWGQSVLIGFMLCMAIFLLNAGVKKIGAGTASFINMLEPVTSLIVSTLVYRYSITPMAIIGCILIVGSLLFAAKK